MVQRIKITHKRKHYVIVRDKCGVLRVEYVNGVMGRQNLFYGGRIWKQIAAAHPVAFTEGVR